MNKNKLIEIIIICLLGLTPLLWFKPGYLITSVDVDYPLNPIHRFIVRSFSWYPQFQMGTDRSINFSSLFVCGLQAILYKMGFSLITTEKLTYIFWFLLTGLSMYFLISQIIEGCELWKGIARLVSVVVYMFNFYQFFVWPRLQLGISGLILMPIFLGLLIGYSKQKVSYIKAAFIASGTSILCSSIGIQPPLIGSFLIIMFLYFIFYLFLHFDNTAKIAIAKHFFFLIFLLGVFFVSNSFWLIPEINFILQSGYSSSSIGASVYKVYDLVKWVSSSSNFLNLFRGLGDIMYFDKWGGVFYYPLFQLYQRNIVFIFWGFIISILPFFAILLFRKNHFVIFFTLVSLIGLFLSKGTHSSLGNIYLWMMKHIPGFWIYRAPWQKFAILATLGYSVLIGMGIGNIFQILKHKFSRNSNFTGLIPNLFLVGFFILYFGYHYPFILGKMFPGSMDKEWGYHQKFRLGYHIKFPKYLFESADWINGKRNLFNIVLLPDDKTNVYKWGYGGSGDISLLLFNRGLLFRQYGEGMAPPSPVDGVYFQFINSLYNKSPSASVYLKLLNIRYILQRNDFRYNFYGDYDSPQFIKDRLNYQVNINLDKVFGYWDFYKVSDDYFLPHIYPSIPNANTCDSSGTVAQTLPTITFRKINPTRYEVKIENATAPFFLVFSESYHPKWKAYIETNNKQNKEKWEIIAEYPKVHVKEARHDWYKFTPQDIKYLFEKPLPEKSHSLVNGYANAWYIDPKEIGQQNFTITLYFWPQSLFYLGLFISGATLLGCIGYLGYAWRKRSFKKK